EVVYESIPPIITDLPDLCDTFSESRTIWAEVVELESDSFDVFLTVRIGRNGAPDTLDMVYNGDNYFWADISYSYGDTLYYYVWARDSEGMAQVSMEKFFVCVEPPQETHILLIDDSEYGSGFYYTDALEEIDSSYFYWNIEQHKGIDITVLHYSGFQTLIILDGREMILPVTDDSVQDIYAISGFLDSGGNLMLVDMDYLYRWDMIGAGRFETGDFAYDYLGIEDYTGDPDDDITSPGGSADSLMLSVSDNPVTSTDTTVYGPVMYRLNGVENWADFIEPTFTASGVLKGKNSGNGMAVCLDGSHFRTITFAFPIELAADPAEFINLLDSSLQWLCENTTRLDSASGLIQEEQAQGLQSSFRLNANYPNPFNSITAISFNLLRKETVDLTVYNIKGEVVGTLVHRTMTPGNYTIDWNAVNECGIPLPSGLYFYRLSTKKRSVTKKMILLR
ncbi:MAG: T9SS type A sorting domain-containing protein, partial [Candidatus Marinimicrobia bacterium]|nr:T9SS type A sorting domain-containing protein [Candidatus Neomarinimicrobiota bacterium]